MPKPLRVVLTLLSPEHPVEETVVEARADWG